MVGAVTMVSKVGTTAYSELNKNTNLPLLQSNHSLK